MVTTPTNLIGRILNIQRILIPESLIDVEIVALTNKHLEIIRENQEEYFEELMEIISPTVEKFAICTEYSFSLFIAPQQFHQHQIEIFGIKKESIRKNPEQFLTFEITEIRNYAKNFIKGSQ